MFEGPLKANPPGGGFCGLRSGCVIKDYMTHIYLYLEHPQPMVAGQTPLHTKKTGHGDQGK